MTNRVALGLQPGGRQGLRVSRPGFDVMDPNLTPKQLAFDSNWPAAMRVHMAGSAAFGAAVYFGRTFPTPPMVMAAYTTNAGRIRLAQVQTTQLAVFTDRFALSKPIEAVGSAFSYYVMAP